MTSVPSQSAEEFLPTLKRSAAALRDAGIPFVLAGGMAAWARGGFGTDHDLDYIVKPEDAERALAVLVDHGFREDRPPEEWLLKAWDGDTLVDLIYSPSGLEITDEVIERSDWLPVYAIEMRVMRPDDILVTKLMAMTEHTMNYRSCLEIGRALREQIDWEYVREKTRASPFACAYFTLIEGLGILDVPHPAGLVNENGSDRARHPDNVG
jgi:hypothetical protein